MRTQDQLAQAAKTPKSFFGFDAEVYLNYLDFEHAKPFLKEEFLANPDAEKEWNAQRSDLTEERVKTDMREYMEFAWGKAIDHRGLSANRSIDKMMALLFVLGDDEFAEKVEATPYPQYGAPKLALICEKYGFPMPDSPMAVNMAKGLPCHPGCDNGCGAKGWASQ